MSMRFLNKLFIFSYFYIELLIQFTRLFSRYKAQSGIFGSLFFLENYALLNNTLQVNYFHCNRIFSHSYFPLLEADYKKNNNCFILNYLV